MKKIFTGRIPLSRPVSTALLAQPISANWPHRFSPPGHYQAVPDASQTRHVSLTSSWAHTILHPTRYGACYPPKSVPFLYSGFMLLTDAIPVDRSPSSRVLALPRRDPTAAPSGPIMHQGIPLCLLGCR
jgi:hypothetical protein